METHPTACTLAHDARCRRIIFHATQAFLTRGNAGTLLDDVACHASVSKLTLYRLFGSKLDLAATVLHSLADLLESSCGGALDLDCPVDEYLQHVGVAYLRWFIQPIGKCHVYEQVRLFTELSSLCPQHAAHYADKIKAILIPRLSAQMGICVERGEISRPGAAFISAHFFDTLIVAPHVLLKNQYAFDSLRESDLENIVRGNIDLLLHGCAPRQEKVR